MKKSIIFGVLTVIIISFATTFYFQHQAFSEQKTTMKSNFAKQQKKSDQQIKELQNKNAELEKTIKTNEEKTNALQSELDSVKAEKEQTVATNQETAEPSIQPQESESANQQVQAAPDTAIPSAPSAEPNPNDAIQAQISSLKAQFERGEIAEADYLRQASVLARQLK